MKSKEKMFIYILMIGFIVSLINMNINDFQKHKLEYDKNLEETTLLNLKISDNWVLIDTTIIIDDTQVGTYDWATINATYDWCSGAGTIGDPYIIENLTMIGYNYDACIKISDSSTNFIIRNCTFINTGRALYITGSSYGKLVNNTFSNNSVGASFGFCQDFTISENRFNNNSVGLLISQGDNYFISNNSFRNNLRGLEMVNDVMNSLIYKNTFEDKQSGIYFYSMDGDNNNISSNIMKGCGFDYFGWWGPPVWADTNTIETSNLVNGKPLYFYHNELNLRQANFTNAGQVVLIESNNTHLSDLNISNCSVGISMNLCRNNTLDNSNFSNSAIDLRDCYNINLNNNIITGFDQQGIVINYGNGYNLTNNQMYNCGLLIWGNVKDMYLNIIDTSNEVNGKPLYYFINKTGLDSSTFTDAGQLILVDCKESSIRDLVFSNCYTGILCYNCNNNEFSNITLQGIARALIFENCSNNRILNCQIRDCSTYGIMIYLGELNTIKGCNISNCKYSGLNLDSNENKVTDNTFEANLRYGIIVNGDYNNVTNNEISNNIEIGIRLENTGNMVINNTITQNQEYGMDVSGSHHLITQNNISNNKQDGIFLENANDNSIIKNDIIENEGNGIHISSWCDNNEIISNDIKFNYEFGIFLHASTNFNTICNNNFTGNLVNAEDNGTINVWDNGTLGNYWDDYTGVDDDDDGIGDTPYTDIGGNVGAQDDFPIWWDPPRISIISPIDNQAVGVVAPSFTIEIEVGVPDSMWYTLGSSPTKYFFASNSSINQAGWDAISTDIINIMFSVNDSAGLIASDEIVVRIDRTSPTVSGFNVLIVSLTVIVSLVGVSWNIGKKR